MRSFYSILSCIIAPISIAAVLIACDEQNELHDVPAEELHARAQKLPLHERYEFYQKVYYSSMPSNTIIYKDLVKLGEPARNLAIARALSGKKEDFFPSIRLLIHFPNQCTKKEYDQLYEEAKKYSYESRIKYSCKFDSVLNAR